MTILMLATSDDITLTPYAIKHSASVYVNNEITTLGWKNGPKIQTKSTISTSLIGQYTQ